MPSNVRRRKATKSNKNKNKDKPKKASHATSKQSSSKRRSKRKSKPLIALPLMLRLFVVTMFLSAIYVLKQYYFAKIPSQTVTNDIRNNNVTTDIDFTKIVNSDDVSSRFGALPQQTIPDLKLWKISKFWTDEMAQNISDTIYNEFMDENTRKSNFYFAFNKGNEKIRTNNNIEQHMKTQKQLKNRNRFSYSKYEYRRQLPLYQQILSYINSSFVVDILSNALGIEIVGVSDLFISVYYKDNFLSEHSDLGLGHYAFVNFLSQNWDYNNGGSLHFSCKRQRALKQRSCVEAKPDFNDVSIFKVWPTIITHYVSTVNVNEPRIAITGWFFTTDRNGVFWDSIIEETGYGQK